ncbi:MAG: orotate phosphoribosyltransferase [Chlorobi bacterium]|nr:orotate phosphoribosyltransferase [Chlorobiota bacterium]
MIKNEVNTHLADLLLQINAIKLNTANPFTWASGWKSPIYCDNRKTLSYPEIRNYIVQEFVKLIEENYPVIDLIAGVATGAIAIGALVAEQLSLPFVYVRSEPKKHGLENLVEGDLSVGKNVVVIEDLISTGKSSLRAVEALRAENCDVLGMLAIFTYEFQIAKLNFSQANIKLDTLSNYTTLLSVALHQNLIRQSDLSSLDNWRKNPDKWG